MRASLPSTPPPALVCKTWLCRVEKRLWHRCPAASEILTAGRASRSTSPWDSEARARRLAHPAGGPGAGVGDGECAAVAAQASVEAAAFHAESAALGRPHAALHDNARCQGQEPPALGGADRLMHRAARPLT